MNLQTLGRRSVGFLSAAKQRMGAMYFALCLAMLPGFAFAQAADFDPAPVVAKIGVYVGYGVLILAAWVLGKWTLRAFGIIK